MTELELFEAALEKPAADRAAFLDEACAGNQPLHQRLEALLARHEKAASFLEAPAAELHATVDHLRRERPGAVIAGRYKLLEQIGEGGMGTVWVAEQTEPVNRRVALKLIKPGMDSRQVLSRFEAERQALALMDHPNIAKVHDGGMTDTGRPFFVMELVKGVPITEYCDSVRLSIPDRLKLFIAVCQAVQHAHHKGIIHRDLKPSNILVCLYDGQPVPKVIDFGLAKATSQPFTEHTLYTALGLMVGTPLYMSPEQAEFNNLDVDTRTDIYSLGVILYELLTGTTPLERRQLKDAAFQEILRLIKEVEPSKPSTKLSGSDSGPTVAAQRRLEPAQLSRMRRGDLDWIVMKALEKERSRRYESANGLAREIDRYLHDEPVDAGPPSATYRLKKLAHKHLGLLATASAIAALLVIGTTVSIWQAIRATKAEAIARASEQKAHLAEKAERAAKEGVLTAAEAEKRARQEAEAAVSAEQKARQDAQAAATAEKEAKESALAREAETNAVLNFVEKKVFAAAQPKGRSGGLGWNVTLREAIEAALPFVDQSFKDQPLIEARLRLMLGTSFSSLGEERIAAEQYRMAYEIYTKHRGSVDTYTLYSAERLIGSYSLLGRHVEALGLQEERVALYKARFGLEHQGTFGQISNLASAYAALGRHDEAFKLRKEALALFEAKFGPNHENTLGMMTNMSASYAQLGRHEEALRLREETLARCKATLAPDSEFTLVSMESLANSFAALGNHEMALRHRNEILALQRAKLGNSDSHTLHSLSEVADSYAALGRHAEALTIRVGILDVRKATLGPDHPRSLFSMTAVADSLVTLGRGNEALPIIDDCLSRAADSEINRRTIRAAMRVRLGYFHKVHDAAGCRATAEMWENLNRTDADSLYNAAFMRAVTAAAIRAADSSESAAKDATTEADLAMDWLQKAIAAGYKNAAQLVNDKDLDTLRTRDDFQKLQAALDAGQKKMPQ